MTSFCGINYNSSSLFIRVSHLTEYFSLCFSRIFLKLSLSRFSSKNYPLIDVQFFLLEL